MSVRNGHRYAHTAPTRVLAGLVVPAALGVAAAVLGWAASAPIAAIRDPGPASADALVALAAALVCAVVLALTAVGAALTLVALVTGAVAGRRERLALLLTPRVVRAALGLALGVTVVAGPALGVPAATAAAPPPATSPPAGREMPPPNPSQLLPRGWSPDRPAAPGSRQQPPVGQRGKFAPHREGPTGRANTDGSAIAGDQVTVVVHRGDTLWALAARRVGPEATDPQVAAEWPRWHTANRATIGADPNLILPGQRLRTPQPHTSATGQESP